MPCVLNFLVAFGLCLETYFGSDKTNALLESDTKYFRTQYYFIKDASC